MASTSNRIFLCWIKTASGYYFKEQVDLFKAPGATLVLALNLNSTAYGIYVPTTQFTADSIKRCVPTIVKKYLTNTADNGISSRVAPYLLVLITTAIGVVVFWDYLVFNKLYLFTGIAHDSVTFDLPRLLHFSQYIRTEGIPFWSFSQGLGQDVFPTSLSHIFRSILWIFGPEYAPYGVAYVELLKIILAALFFYSYLRCLELAEFAAVIGGLLFAFSSIMILGGTVGLFSSQAVYFCLLLLAFERFYRWNRLLLFPIAVALIAAHQPFDAYLSGLFIISYTAFRCAYTGWQTRTFIVLCTKIFGLTILGLGISCVFTSGMVLHMLQSGRGVSFTGAPKGSGFLQIFQLTNAMDLFATFTRFFSTDLISTDLSFGERAQFCEAPFLYTGVITLLLAPQILAFPRRKAVKSCLMFLLLWALPVLFPFLRSILWLHAGPYHRLTSFFLGLSLLIFGLIALDQILQGKLRISLLIGTCCSLLLVLIIARFTQFGGVIVPSSQYYISVFIITYTVLLCLLNRSGIQVYVKLLLLLVVCIELACSSQITIDNNTGTALTTDELESKVIGYNDYSVESVRYLQSIDKGFFRIAKDYSSNPEPGLRIESQVPYNDAMAQNYYGTSAYTNFNQGYYTRFLDEMTAGTRPLVRKQWLEGIGNALLLSMLTSVKYHFTKGLLTDFPSDSFELLATFGDVHVLKNRCSFPFGFTYKQYISLRELRKLPITDRHYTILRAFIIDETQKSKFMSLEEYSFTGRMDQTTFIAECLQKNDQNQCSLSLTKHTQNRIEGTINLKEKRLLFLSIPFDKGWHARVDGQEAKIELVNIGFMGIILGPGTHFVELNFLPAYFWPGLTVSVLSLIGYAVLVVYALRKNSDQEKNLFATRG